MTKQGSILQGYSMDGKWNGGPQWWSDTTVVRAINREMIYTIHGKPYNHYAKNMKPGMMGHIAWFHLYVISKTGNFTEIGNRSFQKYMGSMMNKFVDKHRVSSEGVRNVSEIDSGDGPRTWACFEIQWIRWFENLYY